MKSLVDQPDSHGSTPLLVAIQRNNVKVAKCLIKNSKKKPAIDKRNRKNDSPIYLTVRRGQTDVMKEILKNCKYKS